MTLRIEKVAIWYQNALEDGWKEDEDKNKGSNGKWIYFGESPTNTQLVGHIDMGRVGNVMVWLEDGLQIAVPTTYTSVKELVHRKNMCMECLDMNVETQRVGFAGRYCNTCATELRPKIEERGWAD